MLSAIGNVLKAVLLAIGRFFAFVWSKSKIVGALILAVCFVGCLFALDTAFTTDRIYKGVKVGEVDVSNLTLQEASDAISAKYTPNLFATSVYIFADEDTMNSADLDLQLIEENALAEQMSFEEAQENKSLWITSAQALEASLPSAELAEKAFAVGRETSFFDRINAAMRGIEIPVYATFNETLLSNLIADINMTLGYPVVDFGVKFDDNGEASVEEGSVGYIIDNTDFTNTINQKLLEDDSSIVSFVAEVEYTPYKVDRAAAALTCDALNAVMPDSVSFSSEDKTSTFNKKSLSEWIGTEPVEVGEGYKLNPYIDNSKASHEILSEINESSNGSNVVVNFVKEGNDVYVQPQGDVAIPNMEESLGMLDSGLFEGFREEWVVPSGASIETIPIKTEQYSGRLSVEDALSYGLVERFSTFTTQYTNTSSTANRTFNIHLAADRIGNSIATANGGVWSFNDIAGPCDEENGFKEAGVIESGEYTTGIGGGICQVATTVFNAVYASGLPINERHNHTLYSASYPAGRDAAIAYPTLDLRWTNSTSSDVLLRTSYTDNSVTVALIGSNPALSVSTETGEWVEGEKHSTKFEVDKSLAPDASYVKTAGTDGMKISVIRTVKNSSGKITQQDKFDSVYSPITRVIAYGEGSDMTALKKKYAENDTGSE